MLYFLIFLFLKKENDLYENYRAVAGKTAKSILISCGARLAPFDIKELRDLMEYDEYKPLAKIEEMEEQNYNMIDNVLNNGAEKAQREA